MQLNQISNLIHGMTFKTIKPIKYLFYYLALSYLLKNTLLYLSKDILFI